MAENNNKGYSTGGSDSFDLFDSFDSVPVVTARSVTEQPQEARKAAVSVPVAAEPEKEETTERKSPLFAILCAVMCVALIACAVFSFMNISAFKKAAPVEENAEEIAGYNEYAGMLAKYEAAQYPSGIPQSLMQAYAANNDVVGWLYIPGTAVNTPIVQYKDNNFYLRNNFYGTNTKYGTAYADYRCRKSTPSPNQVIYGHNMPSGTHFYDVSRYEDIEWYKKHPVIKYTNFSGEYTYLIYAAFYTTAQVKYNSNYFFNYIYPNMGPQSIAGYVQQINQRAIYNTGISISSSDRLITLSTCTHSLDSACGVDLDGRLVVVGRLIRAGESENVDTSKAVDNPNYRRPQIWYDHNGKKNPYAPSKWVPSEK